MEQIYIDTIEILTTNNKDMIEKNMDSIIFLTKQVIKKIYINKLLKDKTIKEYIQEQIQSIKKTTPNSKNHKLILSEYHNNLEKILETNLFEFIDNINIELTTDTIKKEIEKLNNKHLLRLKEIINDNHISKQNLVLALMLIYNPNDFDNKYLKLKKHTEKQKNIIDLEIILKNVKQNSTKIINQIEILEKIKRKKEHYQKPKYINIISSIKYIKFNKKIDFKIKEETIKFINLLQEEQSSKENKELKQKYLYDNSNIRNILEEIEIVCEYNHSSVALTQLKQELQEEYKKAIIKLEKIIKKIENNIKPVELDNKFEQQKIEEYINNKRNNYITYIKNIISKQPKHNTKKQIFISTLLVLNFIVNIDELSKTIIDEINKKDYSMLLFDTIYDNSLEENNLKNKVELQNYILSEINILNEKQKSAKLRL